MAEERNLYIVRATMSRYSTFGFIRQNWPCSVWLSG